ncbi:hypothetical protein GLOTRDRAFT_121282 [Gloeophyllum trabeum ATCC 11539]|uniref:Uncharacterized protein n=1 Tax=Gloeophyllum trabeum (strain ATCC 11539 / FP-39264 / Madison 617) TaxID=670483 RepID=S7RN49_GLOTA|nr:uncharacterized protein GLOTRDRAFT_121282 [Gloeophyllum trabeum ATCC 11539]EPQ55890.1 hypothetical protein GLOTRDRAFT_121282 [Gloeophyllum trabeum ATCC 11539]
MQSLFRLFQPKRINTRLFSTTLVNARKPIYFTPRAINNDILALSRKSGELSRDPIWVLANRMLRLKKQEALSQALDECGVSREEFERWIGAVRAYDFDSAMDVLRAKGFALTPAGKISRHLPLWLVIHLLSTKMKTASQARLALPLAVSHMPVTPMHLQAPILILAAYALGQHNLPPLMNPLVTRFLETPMEGRTRALYYNHLLQAISRLPSSWESSRLAVSVLHAMSARQIRLWPRTYKYLLSDQFVTLDLAKMLRDRMRQEGVKPILAHLEAFLKVFSRAGMHHEAGTYLDAIREMSLQKGFEIVPYGTYPTREPDQPAASVTRHNTAYLRSFRDEESVNRYLARLANLEQSKPGKDDRSLRRLGTLRRRRLATLRKRRLDISDWTTILSIAVRNPQTDLKKLWDFFAGPKARVRPTTATFTLFMKAFHDRRDYVAASLVWYEMRRRKLQLDRKALTLGVQVLTMVGKAHNAFHIMDFRAAKPGLPAVEGTIKLDAGVVNAFMRSLIRVRRPDVVYVLWDHMEALYGVRPDVETLNKLLEAAYLGAKLDDTFAGFIANLKLKNPFHWPADPSAEVAPGKRRQVLVERIKAAIADRKAPKGTWNDEPAWRVTRRIFQEVILGNWPHLNDIEPPAHAVRVSPDALIESPVLDLARNILRARRHNDDNARTNAPQSPASDAPVMLDEFGPYPQILPTDATFRAYIVLCGAHAHAGDIPLALAWMRALAIPPRKATLALALAYWGEVSMNAPLVERVTGQNEYRRLWAWMGGWVGERGMPTREDVGDALRMLAQMREARVG